MSEKKFRAWNTKNKKYIEIIGFYYFDDRIVLWFLDDGGIPNYKNYHVKGIILEQYIDKKDKNDIEIYEGDRIESRSIDDNPSYKKGDLMFTGVVIYNKDLCSFVLRCGLDFKIRSNMDLKIIGNIHEATP